ncbi:MAG: ion transporter [Cyclobacteriaceae bacterium]
MEKKILNEHNGKDTRIRKKAFKLLDPIHIWHPVARAIELLLLGIIFLNIVAIILESVQEINEVYGSYFRALEIFSVILFSIEYAFRVWTCVENPRYKERYWGRLRYMSSSMAVIDLLSILPFYLAFLPMDLRFLRIIRLFRLFRLLKIARYLKALTLIQAVLRERKEQIYLSVMFVLFLLVIVSTLMFYVENEAQPKVFSSIPASMWWGIETLTTVGYGDMLPTTAYGKILGGMISVLGIGLFALPAGILSSGLSDHLQKADKAKGSKCPHCGEPLGE